MKKVLLSGFLTAMVFSIFAQTQVGRTLYDLQSNNSNCRRLAINPAGQVLATYTRSYQNSTTFTDRGTGVNYSADNGATWSETAFNPGVYTSPDTSRTGWPNPVFTNTKEVIISHLASDFATDPNGLQVLRRNKGSNGPWEKQVLNSSNSTVPANNAYADDATWARAASKGDSIFVIFGLSEGSLPGMTGGILMYRSTDAGATWIGPDEIPLVNSSNFVSSGGDNYALDINANGKIAIVLGTYQVECLTSTDWGATFTKQTVVAVKDVDGNPAPLFDGQAGETMDTVDASDRCYSVVVDDNDKVHVWFGRTRSFKDELTTSGTSYLPLSVGLVYWNDAMTEGKVVHESRLAAQQVGLPSPYFTGQVFSSNSGFGAQLDLYRATLTSMPSGSYDDNGNIYVAYSGMVPATFDDITILNEANNVNPEGLHFREIYLLKSSDNGATWEGPLNVSNAPLKESVFPSVPRKIYNAELPVIWQEDDIPGVNLQIAAGVSHPVTVNAIMFASTPVADIVSPADITAPTLMERIEGENFVDAFTGCDIDFGAILESDDVPSGENVLPYSVVLPSVDYSVPGVHAIFVYVLDAAGNSSDTLEVIVNRINDTEAPVVTLNGPDTVSVLNGTTYTDPGIVFTDNGCDPSGAPIVTSTVNTAVDGTYTYTWVVTDNSGNATSVTRTVNVVGSDVVAPVITVNGSLALTIEACTSYTDAGASAFDNIDYDLTSSITTTGTVNANLPGVYNIVYSVTDAAGNAASLTRVVTVVDNTAPVITINNTAPSLFVCVGSTFVASATATDCVDSNVSLTNNANTAIDYNTPGSYVVTFTATDYKGNASSKNVTVQVGKAPVADFNITSAPGAQVVQVADASTGNPNSWVWNWNDPNNANNSFSSNAIHPYQTAGTYEIKLTVSNNFVNACGATAESLSITKTVSVSVGIAELNKLNAAVNVYPNPSNGIINVSIDESDFSDMKVSIYNLIGELISSKSIANTSSKVNASFDLGNDAAGIYFVTIATENATLSKKVIVK